MGEDESARIGLLTELASMEPHPESVPINHLVGVANTPLGDSEPLDGIDFVRTIATARILMPKSMVRLSAGREGMSQELQALCFLAGANSIFVGEELLTTPNPEERARAPEPGKVQARLARAARLSESTSARQDLACERCYKK